MISLARLAAGALGFVAAATLALPATAQDHSGIYTAAEIAADAERLSVVIGKLRDAADTVLTAEEQAALEGLSVEFPTPVAGDKSLEFYAFSDFGERVVVMPVMSLKMLEDVTTAYAYLLDQGYSPGAIDLYFAMIERESAEAFEDGRYPALLPALGVPADAWKLPRVDELSLRLRNEAFAFVFFHELGHIVLRHKDLGEVTPAEAVADETAADRFALDLLGRTGTPALGASLLFQAQAYGQPNQGGFETAAAWLAYMNQQRTHPVTTERLRAFSAYVEETLAAGRPAEQALWLFIGAGLNQIADILDDVDIQRCIARIAAAAPVSALRARAEDPMARFIGLCQ